VHALDENGMVLCNPRDREAAHRADVGDIVIGAGDAVTCTKCKIVMLKRAREQR
jgi:hypothetical protein